MDCDQKLPSSIIPSSSVATLFHYQNGLWLRVTALRSEGSVGSNPFPLSEWIVTTQIGKGGSVVLIVATLFHYQNGLWLGNAKSYVRQIYRSNPFPLSEWIVTVISRIKYLLAISGSNPFPLSEWIVTTWNRQSRILYSVATLFHYQNGLWLVECIRCL
mgnify:CR=1 FL=1